MMHPRDMRNTIIAVSIAIFCGFMIRAEIRGNALDEERYRTMIEERDVATAENDILRQEKTQVDLVAADSFAVLRVVIADAERRITVIAAEGRQTFIEIIEAVPDSMPELRAQIELRERMHENEVAVKDLVIEAERDAASVLRNQLRASNGLLAGIESELVLANDQIVFLENLHDDGLSNLESASIGLGAYIVAVEALNATTVEGAVIGGVTFLVVKGGSKFISWLF